MKMYLRLFVAICLSPLFAMVILSFYAAPLLQMLPKRKSAVPDNPYANLAKPAGVDADVQSGVGSKIAEAA